MSPMSRPNGKGMAASVWFCWRGIINPVNNMKDSYHFLIEKAEAGRALTRTEAEAFMEELLSGRMATPEIVRMLMALNQRPVSVAELTGFAQVMRRHAAPVVAAADRHGGHLRAGRRRQRHIQYFHGGGDCGLRCGCARGQARESRGEFAQRLG